MHTLFQTYKTAIEHYLRTFFIKKQKELSSVNVWGSDVCKRYLTFALQGKMIRGCLIILGFEMFGKKATEDVVKAAAAMELFQSALLIHDDIMDHDTMRRGQRTIFAQYGVNHFGESMGMCAGDIGFFFAFELLADMSQQKYAILPLICRELVKVGVAQMQDVSVGNQKEIPSEADILNLYRYKTARYTFSLPLMVGAILAGQSEATINILEKLGEDLGIMFQLKDDELDFESDQREGKKTLLWLYQGNRSKVDDRMATLAKEAKGLIAKLPVDAPGARMLGELLEYNIHRTQ